MAGGGMASFGNKMRWLFFLTIFPLLVCHQAMPKQAPPSMSITPGNEAAVVNAIKDAEVILLGRLTSRDCNWKPCPGSIAPSTAKMKFKIIKSFKGPFSTGKITVWYPFICKNPEYVEYGGLNGAGFRLSPTFFVKGYDYIVLAKRINMYNGEEISNYIFDDHGIIMATNENIKKFETLLINVEDKK